MILLLKFVNRKIARVNQHINGQTLRGDLGDGDVGWGESSLCGMKGGKRGGGYPLINDVRRGRPGGQES